ncbi:MAG: family 78 glycoside hydrolase catalytic domain [Kiritimatiellia bacterium]
MNIKPFDGGRRWAAKWIWHPDARPGEQNVYYYFRKTFDLPTKGDSLRMFIAADTRYRLYVNGRFVGRGAPQSQTHLQYYDTYDVGEYLQAGVNCLAVLVYHLGTVEKARGGLLAELVDADARTVEATNESWNVRRAEAWEQDTHCVFSNKMTPFQEVYDARKALDGWQAPGFDDRGWARPEILAGRVSDRPPAAKPWWRLVPRDIPFMHSETALPARIESVEEGLDLGNSKRHNNLAPSLSAVGKPVQYTRVDGAENLCRGDGDTIVQCSVTHRDLDFDGVYAPAIILDFGKIITARVRLRLNGVAGGMVDIGYAERLVDGQFNIALQGSFADRYVMKNGEQEFETAWWKAFRYLKIRFRACFEPVTVHAVEGVVSTYPFEERGGFSSSDHVLNGVFEISRHTLRLCSNECLMDTPWREQAQWLGDVALITVPAIYACFGDTRLPGKFYRQAAANQQRTGFLASISNIVTSGTIPDYSLWWLRGLWGHYLYTGDADWIHRYYPEVLRLLYAHFPYLNERGLIEDMPHWVFIDWADTERRGECAAYNAIFYAALQALREMATLEEDARAGRLVDTLMAGIRGSFQERLFNEERGCFADANIDGALSEKISEHANMSAICFGLCDGAQAAAIIRKIYETETLHATEAQPFFTAVVLKALDRAGRFDLALRLVRDRWGKRMLARGATATFEQWYQNGTWRSGAFDGCMNSSSHAWSACPAEFLIVNLMGLEILAPGCRRVRLNPKRVDFDYRAVFAAPQGPIAVEYKDGECKISPPDGVEVERVLPAGPAVN